MKLVSNEKLDELLAASPAPRVTKEGIQSRIAITSFHHLVDVPTVTICNIVLDNGYSVRGESACVNLENYNEEIGNKIAFDNAFSKLWPLYGFLLAEDNLRARTPEEDEKSAIG
jgi:hypothetical protein